MPKRPAQPGLSDASEAISSPQTSSKRQKFSMSLASRSAPSTPSRSTPKTKVITESPKQIGKNKIVVAIDYGTTYSGVALVMTINSDARDIQVITDWANGARKNGQLEKVPSRYAYAAENDGIAVDKWGYEVEAGMKSYSWTKLLLDETASHTDFDNHHLYESMGRGLLELPVDKTAADVATDYLKQLHQHTMNRLAKVLSKETLKVTNIDFWFTVPANWQDAANDATRAAASNAGFGSRKGDELYLITEPEAAAMAILNEAIEKNPGLYKVRTNVLIADLGGGTLDFQCLTIGNTDPLRTSETCEGIGGKSGSTYIDCNCHEWLEDTFGDAFKKLSPSKTAPGSAFMEQWELVKKTFNGKDLKKVYRLHLPALGKSLRDRKCSPTSYDFDDFDVLLTGYDISKMFQPVVEKALGLIDEQIKLLKKEKEPLFKVIALCGGLESSEFIWSEFQRYCNEKLDGKVQLVTDDKAWSAVVRGAAVRGLDGSMVLSKKAKRCYGIGVHQEFRKGVDKEEDAVVCPINGKRATGYIDWFVKKGTSFTPNLRALSKVYVPIHVDDEDEEMQFVWDLYSCALDEAPILVNGAGVEHQGKIRLDLSKTFRKQKTNDVSSTGHEAADVNIVLKMGSDRGVLVVEALHNRKVVCTARIEYGRAHARKTARSAGLL